MSSLNIRPTTSGLVETPASPTGPSKLLVSRNARSRIKRSRNINSVDNDEDDDGE